MVTVCLKPPGGLTAQQGERACLFYRGFYLMTTEQGAFSWLIKQGMNWFGKGQLAKTSGRLRLQGLKDRVEIIRDRWGVPHIYAENEQDLFF
ncbi:MAG: hypothetical protein EHM21_16520, partial [Chloroflexi bacterium]